MYFKIYYNCYGGYDAEECVIADDISAVVNYANEKLEQYADEQEAIVKQNWEDNFKENSNDRFEDSNEYLWFIGSINYIIELSYGSDGSGITDLR